MQIRHNYAIGQNGHLFAEKNPTSFTLALVAL